MVFFASNHHNICCQIGAQSSIMIGPWTASLVVKIVNDYSKTRYVYQSNLVLLQFDTSLCDAMLTH